MVAKKKRKSHKIPSDRVIIRSPYALNQEEMNQILDKFPDLKELTIKNVVEKELMAGVVINKGTKMIDLSLKGGLQNLKQFIYDSN